MILQIPSVFKLATSVFSSPPSPSPSSPHPSPSSSSSPFSPLNPKPILISSKKSHVLTSNINNRYNKNQGKMGSLIRILVCHLFLVLAVAGIKKEQSIYDVLKSHGLPMGLLPKGVREFDIDDKGRFEVHLDQACNAKFESELHYERNVSGTLSYGQIRGLSGISAQELFLWFPVKGIRVDIPSSGVIYFDVGVVYKQFSLSLFETPRECVAVREKEDGDDGILPEAVSKGQSSMLRYRLEQERFASNVV